MAGPQRIVCLTEETTETLYLLGEQDRIVGISEYTLRPPEARREKPVVAQFVKAKFDEILSLRPDLVLAFSDLQADLCAELIRRGVAVHCFNRRSIEGIFEMIRTLSRLVDVAKKGEQLVAEMNRHLDQARQAADKLPCRPRVYFEEWPDPIITGIRWVSELIELAGGTDCFLEMRDRPAAKDRIVEPSAVVERRPDLYLASWCGRKFRAEQALSRPGFAGAAFTQPGRMIEIPSHLILQPGPACLTDGLGALQKAINSVGEELASEAMPADRVSSIID